MTNAMYWTWADSRNERGDREAWRAMVHEVMKELNTNGRLNITDLSLITYFSKSTKCCYCHSELSQFLT